MFFEWVGCPCRWVYNCARSITKSGRWKRSMRPLASLWLLYATPYCSSAFHVVRNFLFFHWKLKMYMWCDLCNKKIIQVDLFTFAAWVLHVTYKYHKYIERYIKSRISVKVGGWRSLIFLRWYTWDALLLLQLFHLHIWAWQIVYHCGMYIGDVVFSFHTCVFLVHIRPSAVVRGALKCTRGPQLDPIPRGHQISHFHGVGKLVTELFGRTEALAWYIAIPSRAVL